MKGRSDSKCGEGPHPPPDKGRSRRVRVAGLEVGEDSVAHQEGRSGVRRTWLSRCGAGGGAVGIDTSK